MPDIFISHATTDDDLVNKVHGELKATGLDFWIDHQRLVPPESNWRTAIHQGLQDSTDGVLLLLSRNTVKRPEIDGEWTYCLNVDRPLFVAKMDDVPPMEINPRLHIVQWIDLSRDWNTGIQALTAVLQGKPLPPAAPVIHMVKLTGTIDRRLTQTPLRGRDADVTAIKNALKTDPTVIVGVGGLGKSKLAAEVALSGAVWQGIVWQRINEYTQVYDVIELLRQHFELKPEIERHNVLKQLKTQKTLIVLDNAEDVPSSNQLDFVNLINELLKNDAQVLLTSRVEWKVLTPVKHLEPTKLEPADARQLVLDIAGREGVHDLEKDADEIASAAVYHPRLIEWAVELLTTLPRREVLNDLRTRQSEDAQEAMQAMVGKTLDRLISSGRKGKQAVRVLKRLVVCRGGFTLDAARALVRLQVRPAEVQTTLITLTVWRFVRFDPKTERYDLPPIVIAALTPDISAHRSHFDYYYALAKHHEDSADHEKYLKLDIEAANLEVAFEWVMAAVEYEQAYSLYAICQFFLPNRGRFEQNKNWVERLAIQILDKEVNGVRERSQSQLYSAVLCANVQLSIGNGSGETRVHIKSRIWKVYLG